MIAFAIFLSASPENHWGSWIGKVASGRGGRKLKFFCELQKRSWNFKNLQSDKGFPLHVPSAGCRNICIPISFYYLVLKLTLLISFCGIKKRWYNFPKYKWWGNPQLRTTFLVTIQNGTYKLYLKFQPLQHACVHVTKIWALGSRPAFTTGNIATGEEGRKNPDDIVTEIWGGEQIVLFASRWFFLTFKLYDKASFLYPLQERAEGFFHAHDTILAY